MNTNCPMCGHKLKAQSERTLAPVPPALLGPAPLEAWNTWLRYLRQKRKWPTLLTQERQLAKLAAMGADRAVATINNSIEKGWIGLFEPDRVAQAKPASTWELKQQCEAVDGEIRDIKWRGTVHPLGWVAASPEDSTRLKALRVEQKRLRGAMQPQGMRVT